MTTDNFRFYLQNILIQTSQMGGQQYSGTSPFSIACLLYWFNLFQETLMSRQEEEGFVRILSENFANVNEP
jgi:hypothetical protein